MTTWNYRVIRAEDEDGTAIYSIHECYYESRGDLIPNLWSKEPIAVVAETREGLLLALGQMNDAVVKPVLEVRDDTHLVEVEPEVKP